MGTILYNIIIGPIVLFIEIVFSVANSIFNNPGFAIIFVSLAVQLLCFPLYKRADEIQAQERLKQSQMKYWLDHIRKTFKGDERFMIQQAYYKLADYKPIYAIKGSVSLLLQIPFFIAAYSFLSELDTLKGASFIGITDLSQPDQLIHIGTLAINILPVLMTLFNIISAVIYTKGFPLKDKIQTYGLALVFLILLYKSPSGLVFYWTLNNVFSLFKNIFQKKIKNPKKVIKATMFLIGLVVPVYTIFFSGRAIYLKLASVLVSIICILPVVISFIKKRIKKLDNRDSSKPVDIKQINALFYSGLIFLFMLLACYIPFQVVKSSPTEFISMNYGPYGLLLHVICTYIGILFVWVNIFYLFSSPKVKRIFAFVISAFSLTALIDYLFFGRDLGTMSNCFVYDKYPEFSIKIIAINLLVVAVVVGISLLLFRRKSKYFKTINQIAAFSLGVLVVFSVVSIEKTLDFEGHPEKVKAEDNINGDEKILTFNKNGKNVIVFMLDRAVSGYFPFAIEENPQIKEMFDGFTYYPNTVSFGGYTNYASPALFGGYEYTPTQINKRASEKLASKQNEALTVMPRLFADNQYKVTVVDPPYANYRWNYDTSIYDEYDDIDAYEAIGKYSYNLKQKYSPLYEASQKRSFIFFSLMKALPLATQNIFYQSGCYWAATPSMDSITTFLNSYTVLENLQEITNISDSSENTFLMMQNNTTHEPIILQEPDYEISITAEDPAYRTMTSEEGVSMKLLDKEQLSHYQTFCVSMLKIGEWLQFLKDNGVYDNARIIIVSDHGRDLNQFSNMELSNGIDAQTFNPLLLVKDFNSTGFKVSDDFMTNADTPYLAVNNLIQNPVNPFTNKKILDKSEQSEEAVLLTTANQYSVLSNNGNVFDTSDGDWWLVENNLFDVSNWKKVEVN